MDIKYLQRVKIVYSRLSLEELLREENLVQRYLYKHGGDDFARKLYSILSKEIEKKLV